MRKSASSAPGADQGAASLEAVRESEVTRLLVAWQAGDSTAGERLARRLYPELRRLAAARLRGERDGCTVQPTELVSELMVRLLGSAMPRWESRAHFFGIASRLLRQILVDLARRRGRDKRGGGARPISLDVVDLEAPTAASPFVDVLALEQILERLRRADPVAEELVCLRFYGGLNIEDAAEALQIGRSTAVRRFRAARAYIRQQLADATAG